MGNEFKDSMDYTARPRLRTKQSTRKQSCLKRIYMGRNYPGLALVNIARLAQAILLKTVPGPLSLT